MKFSDKTISILKNFHTINPSVLFVPGTKLKTKNPNNTIICIAQLDDEIPSKACVYDVSRLLSICSLYDKPDVEFKDTHFVISEGKRKTKYIYTDEKMIVGPPENDGVNIKFDVEVKLPWNDLQSVIKAAGVLQYGEIVFVGNEGTISIKTMNSKNPTSDSFGVEIGETENDFQLIIKTENLKLIPNTYNVSLSSKGISKFESEDKTLTYYVAVEKNESYFKKG